MSTKTRFPKRRKQQNVAAQVEVVTISVSQLEEIVEDAVTKAVKGSLESVGRDISTIRECAHATTGILTKSGVARLLGVTTDTIGSYVREQGLPCHRPGKAPLFLVEEVKDWVQCFGSSIDHRHRREAA